jgi:hypothetical protein
MVIAGAHAELFSWAARMVCDAAPARASTNAQPEPPPRAKGNGVEPHRARRPAARKPKSKGVAAHLALRREARDRDDENLRQAMRDSPASSIGDWAKAIGKSRTSVVAGLHRLRDAGLATNADKAWVLVEPAAPRAAAPRWVAPLSAASHARVSP